jgi:hypothetical protein
MVVVLTSRCARTTSTRSSSLIKSHPEMEIGKIMNDNQSKMSPEHFQPWNHLKEMNTATISTNSCVLF